MPQELSQCTRLPAAELRSCESRNLQLFGAFHSLLQPRKPHVHPGRPCLQQDSCRRSLHAETPRASPLATTREQPALQWRPGTAKNKYVKLCIKKKDYPPRVSNSQCGFDASFLPTPSLPSREPFCQPTLWLSLDTSPPAPVETLLPLPPPGLYLLSHLSSSCLPFCLLQLALAPLPCKTPSHSSAASSILAYLEAFLDTPSCGQVPWL